MSEEVGIIGAGVSGLAAAYALSKLGIRSRVFEKSRGFSGRAATRRREGLCFDHGANFFRLDDPAVDQVIRNELPADELVTIDGPVWTFDQSGSVMPGDAEENTKSAWSYQNGISTLGKLLHAAAPHSTVERGCRIAGVSAKGDGWALKGDDGGELGVYSRLLVTAPPPQTIELLAPSGLEVTDVLGDVRYAAQFTFVLGFDQRIEREQPFHALLNVDRKHPIAWVSFEDDKPGHVPADQSVVVVQMSPTWTDERMEMARDELLPAVLEALRPLIPVSEPDWWDSQRWRYALPLNAVPLEKARRFEGQGIFFAGDGLVGKGRVALALKSGLEVAERIAL